MEPRITAPYGTWASRLSVQDVVVETVSLGEPWVDGDDIYWLEGRPTDGGRRVLVRHSVDGTTTDLTPAPLNVRSRVHEYGGGSYTARGGTVVFSHFADGRLHRLGPEDPAPVPITPPRPWRFADLRIAADGRTVDAVREDHSSGGEPRNEIVRLPLDGSAEPAVLVTGPDFVAAPRRSPDGGLLAWLEWDHPTMPWDAARLLVGTSGDGARRIAGGDGESIVQPVWTPDGWLVFMSDRAGWWNPWRWRPGGSAEPLLPEPVEIEFADPAWLFDRSSFVVLPDGAILAAGRARGRDRLYRIEQGRPPIELEATWTEVEGLRATPDGLVAIVARPSESSTLVRLNPATGETRGVLRRAAALQLHPDWVSVPEPIEFPTANGALARGLYYPPRNPSFAGPESERPPLVVETHGGPTAAASTGLDLEIQLLTSRGIAVVDVDYRGSTGYGRAYRDALRGTWGIVDVEDAAAAARFLADRGDVDPARLVVQGASAGGYTTLCALVDSDLFAAGISMFGIGDLEILASDTHKFESRYIDWLVAPLPGGLAVCRQRSPIHAFDRLRSPLLILQGLDDRVVPPSQAEAMVAALRRNGVTHAYVPFEGEGHGFRGRAAIVRSLEARLSFLAQVLGFELADRFEPIDVVRPGGATAARADQGSTNQLVN